MVIMKISGVVDRKLYTGANASHPIPAKGSRDRSDVGDQSLSDSAKSMNYAG
jgi:hypothetical protein